MTESGPATKISVQCPVKHTMGGGLASKRQTSTKENNNGGGASLSSNLHDTRGFVDMKFNKINSSTVAGSSFGGSTSQNHGVPNKS